MEASLDQEGDGWKPHLARFMQPLFLPSVLIGEGAPDRSLSWGLFSGGQGGLRGLLDWIPGSRGAKAKGPALAIVWPFRFLVNGLARGVEACLLALRSWPGQVQNEATGECR